MKNKSKANFQSYHSNTAFLDLLFNCLLGFTAFFVIAFLSMNPKVKEAKNVESKAEFVITISWDKSHLDDVDTFVEDPEGGVVWYGNKEVNLMHLDRDDLGHANDTIKIGDKVFAYNENIEVVTLRGIIPKEYVVNVHMYAKRSDIPVEVTVMLEKLNPTLKLCAIEKVILNKDGDERTAFRFVLSDEGEVIEINQLAKRFVRSVSNHGPHESELEGNSPEFDDSDG